MFGAVASHKFVISFCMGMELFAARTKLSTYLSSIIFFGVISPVGIFIGSLISGNDTNVLPIAIIKVTHHFNSLFAELSTRNLALVSIRFNLVLTQGI